MASPGAAARLRAGTRQVWGGLTEQAALGVASTLPGTPGVGGGAQSPWAEPSQLRSLLAMVPSRQVWAPLLASGLSLSASPGCQGKEHQPWDL